MSANVELPPEKQTRIQSPSYPIMSLEEAVGRVGKLYKLYRSSTMDRLDAAKNLGYAGATGPSNMALASLSAYGLLERVGKGEVRVTERARSILHSDSPDELAAALHEAAHSPTLYRELRERFPDILVPPEDGVTSYLNRKGFNHTAVRPAARAYLQTMRYLEKAGVTESSGHAASQAQKSFPPQSREDASMSMTTYNSPAPPPPAISLPMQSEGLSLNEPTLSIRAGTVHVEALLDYEGLTELESQIKALRMILKPKKTAQALAASQALIEPPEDDGANQ